MLKLNKAATVAAIFATLGSAAIIADPGFAFGSENNAALTADMIVIDPATLTADQNTVKLAKSDKVVTTLNDKGDIIFTPGTGAAPVESDEDNSDAGDGNAQKAVAKASSLAELVRLQDTDDALSAEEHCLAGAVYFESKGESLAGQLAVARVVMARAKSGRFPSSLCGVVFQRSQFSFVRGGGMPPISKGSNNWRNAVAISKIALNDAWKSPVEGALFFHARYVSPGWRLTRLGSIDNHIFYR